MDYPSFISELRGLLEFGRRFGDGDHSHVSPDFRDWRHRVESLVNLMRESGYTLPGEVRSSIRGYRVPSGYVTAEDHRQRFKQESNDTLIELSFLIEHFDKYGYAPAKKPPKQAKPLAVPEKITIRWLLDHAPLKLWGWYAATLIAAFGFGVAVPNTTAFKVVQSFLNELHPEMTK